VNYRRREQVRGKWPRMLPACFQKKADVFCFRVEVVQCVVRRVGKRYAIDRDVAAASFHRPHVYQLWELEYEQA
jgi:hypothetical protein